MSCIGGLLSVSVQLRLHRGTGAPTSSPPTAAGRRRRGRGATPGGRPLDPNRGRFGTTPQLGSWTMAEYVFTLRNVRKAHGDKVVLDNVTLSFLHGAKIGVVGPNGTGKSTLLKIMAGLEHANNGDAILDPDATVGMLQQEPPLTEGKTVLENVEEAVGEIKAKLDRLNEISEAMGDPDADYDKLDDRDGRPADRPRPRQRLGPRQPARPGHGRAALPAARRAGRHTSPVASAAGWRCASCCSSSRPAAARRAHQPPRRRVGAVAGGAPQELPGRRPGDHPRPVLPRQRRRVDPRARPRQARTPTRATTRRTWRPRRNASRSRGRRTPSAPRCSSASSSGCAPTPRPGRPRAGPGWRATRRWRPRPTATARSTPPRSTSPPGPRLGDVVLEAKEPGQGLRRPRCSCTTCRSRCRAPASSASSAPTASARPRCSG